MRPSKPSWMLRVAPVLAALAALAPSAAHAAPQGGASASASENGQEIALAIGETKTISAKDIRNYSDGNSGHVDVKLTSDNSQFVVYGKKPGSTTLLLIKNDGTQITYNVHVFARSPQVVEKELADLLDGMPGVRVRRVGAHIVLDGVVETETELKRVQHIAQMYPNQVQALVTLPGGATGSMADGNRFIVRIDFYFVQYDRNSSYGIGLGWPSSVGGDAVVQSNLAFDFVSGSRAATASITNQPIPRLDIASRRGWAKVMKQATVVTNNGVEANFSNGGEQNFTVNTGLTIGVQRIAFGTDVTVLPRYNEQKREIEMRLMADVSDLTAAASGGLPGRTTSKLTTNITLKLGQSIVLSGIKTKSQSRSNTGLPGLSNIPVLGLLFGTQENQELETEGAVFVVPSVVQAVSTPAAEMVHAAVAKFDKYSGNIEKVNTYDKSPGAQPTIPTTDVQ
jgi:pilus assembly protein CpaC